ncbi:MAG: RNA polymerase sigma factor [Vulcanimicrobiota bacterium]
MVVAFHLLTTHFQKDIFMIMSKEPSQRLIFRELMTLVNEALEQLDFYEMMVLKFYLFDNQSFVDISRRLNISQAKVKKLFRTGLAKIKKCIETRYSAEDVSSIIAIM